jgi:signal transduction histidine kinase
MTIVAGLERSILDALPITIYTVDLDGRLTFVNRSWGRFARANGAPQLAENAVVGSTSIWSATTDVAPREQIERAFTLLREGRAQSVTWEFPCSSPDEERIFLMQISPVHEGHAVTGFAFSTVDITPSHRWREVLIETGTALSHAISSDRVYGEVARQLRRAMACDAVAIALADGESDTVRLAHQVGFEQEPAELETALRPVWQQVLASGWSVEREPVAGAAIELTVPMSSAGVRGALTVVAPRSEAPQWRTEMERVLSSIAAQTAGALERAGLVRRVAQKGRLEAIGEVAAGVAHELRNPLFGISSAAQLLRYRVKEDPVIEKNVGRILREVERLNGMVTSLLEYGRPAPTRLAPGDPDQVWEDVLEVQRGLLESKALVLRHTPAEPRATCNLDASQMAQVFVNVLVNAVDAAPEGSDLTLVSGVAHGHWRCRLHDDGPAIPPDVLPRVFEIFFSTKPGGTGIGLALCQRIVEEHGGSIALESAPEQGTTLTITLPQVAG